MALVPTQVYSYIALKHAHGIMHKAMFGEQSRPIIECFGCSKPFDIGLDHMEVQVANNTALFFHKACISEDSNYKESQKIFWTNAILYSHFDEAVKYSTAVVNRCAVCEKLGRVTDLHRMEVPINSNSVGGPIWVCKDKCKLELEELLSGYPDKTCYNCGKNFKVSLEDNDSSKSMCYSCFYNRHHSDTRYETVPCNICNKKGSNTLYLDRMSYFYNEKFNGIIFCDTCKNVLIYNGIPANTQRVFRIKDTDILVEIVDEKTDVNLTSNINFYRIIEGDSHVELQLIDSYIGSDFVSDVILDIIDRG